MNSKSNIFFKYYKKDDCIRTNRIEIEINC